MALDNKGNPPTRERIAYGIGGAAFLLWAVVNGITGKLGLSLLNVATGMAFLAVGSGHARKRWVKAVLLIALVLGGTALAADLTSE